MRNMIERTFSGVKTYFRNILTEIAIIARIPLSIHISGLRKSQNPFPPILPKLC